MQKELFSMQIYSEILHQKWVVPLCYLLVGASNRGRFVGCSSFFLSMWWKGRSLWRSGSTRQCCVTNIGLWNTTICRIKVSLHTNLGDIINYLKTKLCLLTLFCCWRFSILGRWYGSYKKYSFFFNPPLKMD